MVTWNCTGIGKDSFKNTLNFLNLAGTDLNHSVSYDGLSLSIYFFRIMCLNRSSIYTLNTWLLITERDAAGRIYAIYADGIRDFSGLRKRSRCGNAFDHSGTPPLLRPYC